MHSAAAVVAVFHDLRHDAHAVAGPVGQLAGVAAVSNCKDLWMKIPNACPAACPQVDQPLTLRASVTGTPSVGRTMKRVVVISGAIGVGKSETLSLGRS